MAEFESYQQLMFHIYVTSSTLYHVLKSMTYHMVRGGLVTTRGGGGCFDMKSFFQEFSLCYSHQFSFLFPSFINIIKNQRKMISFNIGKLNSCQSQPLEASSINFDVAIANLKKYLKKNVSVRRIQKRQVKRFELYIIAYLNVPR